MPLAQQSILSIAKLENTDPQEQEVILDSVQDSLLEAVFQDEAVSSALGGEAIELLNQARSLLSDQLPPEEKDPLRELLFTKLSQVPGVEDLLAKYVEEFKLGMIEERLALAREAAGSDLESLAKVEKAHQALLSGDHAAALQLL